MKRYSSLLLLTGLATAGAITAAPEAKALCLPNDSICSTFDPSSPSSPTLPAGTFTGTGTSAGSPYAFARLEVLGNTFTGSSFTLSNFTLTGPGINSSLTGFGNVVVNGTGQFFSTSVALNTTLSAADFTQSTLSFTIPQGVGYGTSFTVSVQYADNANLVPAQLATSSADFTTTTIPDPNAAAAPGPLPLLGAAASFAYSRRLRRRISKI